MTIRNSLGGLIAYNQMKLHGNRIQQSVRRLSSGYRINGAADDAAGLAVSEKMRGEIAALKQASRNAQDMASMLQTAEGGLHESHAILQRMRELAVQASNGTYSGSDRANLDIEFQALKEELTRISGATHYNGIKLLDGSQSLKKGAEALEAVGVSAVGINGPLTGNAQLTVQMNQDGTGSVRLQLDGSVHMLEIGGDDESAVFTFGGGMSVELKFEAGGLRSGEVTGLRLNAGATPDCERAVGRAEGAGYTAQIGTGGSPADRLTVFIDEMSAEKLGLADLDIKTQENAQKAIGALETAINSVSSQRAGIGANLSRLDHTVNVLENQILNLTGAESKIRDADMAEEMMSYAKHQILFQAAQAMLAHSNARQSSILQLLYSL